MANGIRSTVAYHDRAFQMIRTIDIQNFRCFANLRIEDCRRLNVIVGDNGTGKTTLLEAIFMALVTSPEIGMRYRQFRGLDATFTASHRTIEEVIWKDFFYDRDWARVIEVALSGDGGPETRTVRVFRGQTQQVMPLNIAAANPGGESFTVNAGDARISPITFQWRDHHGQTRTQTTRVTPRGLEFSDSNEDVANFFMFGASHPISSVETAGRYSELRRAGRAGDFEKLRNGGIPLGNRTNFGSRCGLPDLIRQSKE